MTVTVAVATALLTAAGVMVSRVMGAQRNVAAVAEQTLTQSRLSRQFRADVHQAASAEVGDDGLTVTLQPLLEGQRVVTYRAAEGQLQRISAGNGADRPERFQFSEGTTFRFQTAPAGAATLVTLEMRRTPQLLGTTSAVGQPVRLPVVAQLSRNRRTVARSAPPGPSPEDTP